MSGAHKAAKEYTMDITTIIYRADNHRPAGWTVSGWRRAWRRGQTHTGRPIGD